MSQPIAVQIVRFGLKLLFEEGRSNVKGLKGLINQDSSTFFTHNIQYLLKLKLLFLFAFTLKLDDALLFFLCFPGQRSSPRKQSGPRSHSLAVRGLCLSLDEGNRLFSHNVVAMETSAIGWPL